MMQNLFYTFKDFTAERFPGRKVYKVPVDAGFSCPNRDGFKGYGGCIYCNNESFSPAVRNRESVFPLEKQVENGINFYKKHHNADSFIIYFQTYSNTYGSIQKLRKTYDIVKEFENVVGFAIGTRPDCISDEILDLIEGYSDKYWVCIEYGLQSRFNKTLELINRCHTYEDFLSAVEKTRNRKIDICAHIILGLPTETKSDMLETVKEVAKLELEGIKFHHLYVARNTELEKLYLDGKVKLLSFDEYLDIITSAIELLPPKMVIHRFAGELNEKYVVAPRWGLNKQQIIQRIEERLKLKNSYQGKLYLK